MDGADHDPARRVAVDLKCLGLPPANWPSTVAGPDGQPMLDVLVIGAGMCGIAAAAALIFKGCAQRPPWWIPVRTAAKARG